jgi:two-component system phosphate regulon sensor histidine kinase PhoR
MPDSRGAPSRFSGILWRIAVPYVLLILVTMAVIATYLSGLVREAYLADLRNQLAGEARLVADAMAPSLLLGQGEDVLDTLTQHYADLTHARVTLIGPDGTVLGESNGDRLQMENHLYRPEVQAALTEGEGSTIRLSATLGTRWMYFALPVQDKGQLLAIIRLALPLSQIEAGVARLRIAVLAATLLAAALATLLAVWIAERTARPVRWLTTVVQRVAAGDLGARLVPTTHDELGTLTHAFNQMSERLQDMVGVLTDEQSRLAGVLEHMADGVVITDGDGLVRLLNPAAARLLDTNNEAALGRSFAQVARHYRIIEVWQDCRDRQEERAEPVELGPQAGFLQVIVTPLPAGQSGSCLVILQDLTEVRRLETVRRDFISNVSHELRTPLASLKALAETLRDGALADPEAAPRFLGQMETEVDALTQMVERLLELSRIESGRVPFRLAPTALTDLVLPVVDRLQAQAERAGLQVSVDLPSALPKVMADAQRIQLVLTNLIHNAIKFTPSGGQVTISAEPVANELVVAVRDTGVGIPEDALPRIFERFYKADRSRAGEGTGLGLSIAKHIVQGHGGRIWVESQEGRGSTFYFTLQAAR